MQGPFTGVQVLQELSSIAFARATDCLEIRDGKLVVRSSQELTEGQKAAIASMENTSNGVRVKFYDKLKALELLGKAMGLFEGAVTQDEDNNLLEAILQATAQEVKCDDLPEIQQAAEARRELVESAPVETL